MEFGLRYRDRSIPPKRICIYDKLWLLLPKVGEQLHDVSWLTSIGLDKRHEKNLDVYCSETLIRETRNQR